MKFVYEYRTPDNVRHTDVVAAANREEAFARLKARGIRPGRMEEAPGLFNTLFGKGKRWIVIGALVVLSGALTFLLTRTTGKLATINSTIESTMRRQIIGDAAVIEKGIRTGWAAVFPEEGERFLASFAIPGVSAGQRSTTEAEIRACLSRQVSASPEDSLETCQIKAMVEGMKNELRQFLADNGTIKEYGQRLVERQERELRYHNRVKTELETAAKSNLPEVELEALWENRNSYLRKMGIKLVPLPE